MIDLMKRSLPLGLGVVAVLSAFVSPARADFASCVGSLRADAAHAGISARTLDVAFSGLEPDPKVLDLQHQQPEFKTPVWDYVDGLVDDDRVADGKAAMAREVACARPRRRAIWRAAALCWRRSGGSSPTSARRWASARSSSR